MVRRRVAALMMRFPSMWQQNSGFKERCGGIRVQVLKFPRAADPSAARGTQITDHLDDRAHKWAVEGQWVRRFDACRAATWGFCTIRSFLSACRRRVAALMMQFPPARRSCAWGAVAKVQTH